MSAQPTLLAPVRRPRPTRTICAPWSYPEVADVVDLEHGPDEIPPCPGLDPVGTVYLVGDARERWEIVAGDERAGTGSGVIEGPNGEQISAREATRQWLVCGARIMLLPGWPPTWMERAGIGEPLVWHDPRPPYDWGERGCRG